MNVKVVYQRKHNSKEMYRVDVILGFLRLNGLVVDMTTGSAVLKGPFIRFGTRWYSPIDFDMESENYKQFLSAIVAQLKTDNQAPEDPGDLPF